MDKKLNREMLDISSEAQLRFYENITEARKILEECNDILKCDYTTKEKALNAFCQAQCSNKHDRITLMGGECREMCTEFIKFNNLLNS